LTSGGGNVSDGRGLILFTEEKHGEAIKEKLVLETFRNKKRQERLYRGRRGKKIPSSLRVPAMVQKSPTKIEGRF